MRHSRVQASVIREARSRFGSAFAGQRAKVGRSLGATILAAALDVAKPWPAALVIDGILGKALSDTAAVTGIVLAGASVVLLSVLTGWLNFVATRQAAEVGRIATVRVRQQLFDHLHRLSVPFHTASRVGDLLIRLTGDVTLIRDLLFVSWLTLIELGLSLVAMAVVMAFVDWPTALVLAVPLIHMALEGPSNASQLRDAVRKQRKRQGKSAAMAAESLTQIRLIKAYGAEQLATGKFRASNEREESDGLKAAVIAARIERRSETLSGLGTALALMNGAFRVWSGALSVGELVVLLSYAKSFFKPMRKISSELTRVAKASAVTERILEVLRIEPEDHTAGVPTPRLEGRIEFEDVSFTYPNGRKVLTHLDLMIEPGRVVALMGGNGQGKSTLLSLLLRLVEPDEGRVLVDGYPLKEFQLDSYRGRIGYVPQGLQLFSGTLADNIRFGRVDATDQEVAAAARQAILDDVLARFSEGLETEVGEGASSLSAGEARRLMLARAAVRDADLLLLDEPFAGLDVDSIPAVGRAIRAIASGRTTIVITHGHLEHLQPDMIYELFDGRLVGGVKGQLRS
ncbi:MAG: ABC transporter ATP-binding protein [Acidimicrobiia bacterium]